MVPKKKKAQRKKKAESPVAKQATALKAKYRTGYPKSPGKGSRVRRALAMIKEEKVSIRVAAGV